MEFGDEDAKVYLEKKLKDLLVKKKTLIDRLEENKKRNDDLKIILYSKFGKSIHLDDD